MVKNPPNAGNLRDTGLISGWGRSPGGEYGHPVLYSCLENPMDRRAWRATVHEVTKTHAMTLKMLRTALLWRFEREKKMKMVSLRKKCVVLSARQFDTQVITCYCRLFQITLSESISLVGTNMIHERPKLSVSEVLHMHC